MECSAGIAVLSLISMYLGQTLVICIIEAIHRHLAIDEGLADEPVSWSFASGFSTVKTRPAQIFVIAYLIMCHIVVLLRLWLSMCATHRYEPVPKKIVWKGLGTLVSGPPRISRLSNNT